MCAVIFDITANTVPGIQRDPRSVLEREVKKC
jgi:hypothetical protein